MIRLPIQVILTVPHNMTHYITSEGVYLCHYRFDEVPPIQGMKRHIFCLPEQGRTIVGAGNTFEQAKTAAGLWGFEVLDDIVGGVAIPPDMFRALLTKFSN